MTFRCLSSNDPAVANYHLGQASNVIVEQRNPLTGGASDLRTREYPTKAEVERLIEAARDNRWGMGIPQCS